MDSLLRTCTLILTLHLLAFAAYSQCDSLRQNDSTFSFASDARDIGSTVTLREQDFEKSSRGGYRAQVYLCNGSMMYGDLLTVQNKVLSMHVYQDFSYSPSLRMRSGTYNFNLKEINKVVVKGRSKILQGVFIGFLGGMLTGSVMTRIVEQRTPADNLFGPGALGGVGLIVGGTIGYLSSGNDLEITKLEGNDLIVLKSFCRYPRNTSQ